MLRKLLVISCITCVQVAVMANTEMSVFEESMSPQMRILETACTEDTGFETRWKNVWVMFVLVTDIILLAVFGVLWYLKKKCDIETRKYKKLSKADNADLQKNANGIQLVGGGEDNQMANLVLQTFEPEQRSKKLKVKASKLSNDKLMQAIKSEIFTATSKTKNKKQAIAEQVEQKYRYEANKEIIQ